MMEVKATRFDKLPTYMAIAHVKKVSFLQMQEYAHH